MDHTRDVQQRISFMGANYVARQVGYHMTEGWGQGDSATNDYFRPIETFAQRFEELLRDVQKMGFSLLDLWTPQLNWAWATPEHVSIARDLLARYQLRIASMAGFFGATSNEFEAACRLAHQLDISILGGSTSLLQADRAATIAILKQYNVRQAIENHPAEKTAQDMLALIGDGGDGFIGTALDTGWYATNGYDAVRAIEELYPYLFHMHLKDVLAPGAHETCRYGQGCVDIAGCVETLQRLGYQGVYSIEHEPELFDVGVYPLTILTAIFGPARQITAFGKVLYPDRITKEQVPFHISTPDFAVAAIEFASGAVARLTTNFYVGGHSPQKGIEFHGDLGSCWLHDWQNFAGSVEFAEFGGSYQPVPYIKEPFKGTEWARGVVELAEAIEEDRPARVTGTQAAHVVDILTAIQTSFTEGHPVTISSEFAPPAPMDWAE